MDEVVDKQIPHQTNPMSLKLLADVDEGLGHLRGSRNASSATWSTEKGENTHGYMLSQIYDGLK